MNIYVIFILIALLSWLVQSMLQRRFDKYSRVALNGGLTGKDVAERMLRENGITDVQVRHIKGNLTDHYDPSTKVINLSETVYGSCSIAAAAVAAHETGHAVQHAKSYPFLTLRSRLVPAVNFASRWMQWVLLAGILLVSVFPAVLEVGIVLFALTTLFSIVTLPVEVNASRRAIAWLGSTGITDARTAPMAKDALKWAAYTYFIAAISSLATLIYYILILAGGRRN